MDKGLTVPKWVLIIWPKMPKNLSAQFVCPSPKVWDFNEKRLHWPSVVCATAHRWTPRESFFFENPKLLGLGREIGPKNVGAFWVFFGQTTVPILALWVPCPWFWVFGCFFLQKKTLDFRPKTYNSQITTVIGHNELGRYPSHVRCWWPDQYLELINSISNTFRREDRPN